MKVLRRFGVERLTRLCARTAVLVAVVAVSAVTLATPAQAADPCGGGNSGYVCFYDNADQTHRMAKEFICNEAHNLPSGAWDRTSSVRDDRVGGSNDLYIWSYMSGGQSELLTNSNGNTGFAMSAYNNNKADWYKNYGPCV